MKAKLFSFFFALVLSTGTLFAESGTCGENVTWDLTDGVLTISGAGDMTSWSSSSSVPWYSNIKSIKSIFISSSVTSIGNYAFANCTGLSSVTIPNSVINIGDRAFYYCTNLTSVTIGNSVTSIGELAFSECTSLTSVTIPNSVTNIGGSAFSYCSGLTSITIGNSVTNIGDWAFYNCAGLTSIEIPNSVTSIGELAFSECTSLTSLTLGKGVKEIGLAAFAVCNLVNIIIPEQVKVVGYGAFAYNYIVDKSKLNPEPLYDDNGNVQWTIKTITCYRKNPPRTTAEEYASLGLCGEEFPYSSRILYVPAGSVETYEENEFWGDFDVRAIEATRIDATDLQVTPSNNSAQVIWPVVSGAASYELIIKDKTGNVVCTLIFNSNGQLASIAFNAPARDGAPQKTQASGFSFTVTGLEEGTSYNLTLLAKGENGQELDKKNISFHTEGTQGIEGIHVDFDNASLKILRNGQILILRGEKSYTITGQEVR